MFKVMISHLVSFTKKLSNTSGSLIPFVKEGTTFLYEFSADFAEAFVKRLIERITEDIIDAWFRNR